MNPLNRTNQPANIANPANSKTIFSKNSSISRQTLSKKRTAVDLNTNIRHLNKPAGSSIEEQESSLTAKEIVWLTSKEAASFLKISEATLRNMTSNGKIPYSKLGSSNRYSLNELNRLLLSTQRGIPYGY